MTERELDEAVEKLIVSVSPAHLLHLTACSNANARAAETDGRVVKVWVAVREDDMQPHCVSTLVRRSTFRHCNSPL
jgi:hypothetical protein